MDSRERIQRALDHREADRIPIHDDPWFTTVERWHREGLPPNTTPNEYFNYEMVHLPWGDGSLRLGRITIEETKDHIIERNNNGAMIKNWKHATSTPLLIDFTLTSREAWEIYKPRLLFDEDRLTLEECREAYEQARAAGKFVVFPTAIGYDRLSTIVGPENLLPALLDDPEWVSDMAGTWADLYIQCADAVLAHGIDFDAAFLYDDLGYRDRPFFSNEIYRKVFMPHHRRLCDFFHDRGKKVILHSCGYVTPLIPDFIEAGFDCLQPIEVKAGMDLLALKEEYGHNLALMGGIDVRAMSASREKLETEVHKICRAKAGGGYIYHSDHSVPDDVSFVQYCDVMELVMECGAY
jgi:uroporphyrinogen decarboxylase